MPKKTGITARVQNQAQKLADQMEFELVEVELAAEREGRFLRFYLDKAGGISVNDLEKYHRAIQPFMEDVDYDYMEVSSPGAERPLKHPRDFEKARGKTVELRLYKPINEEKQIVGELVGLDGDEIVILRERVEMRFTRASVAKAAPLVIFDESTLADLPLEDLLDSENLVN